MKERGANIRKTINMLGSENISFLYYLVKKPKSILQVFNIF